MIVLARCIVALLDFVADRPGHDYRYAIDSTKIQKELGDSKTILNRYGLEADYYVTPCGEENEFLVNYARHSYLALRTSEFGVNPLPVKNPYHLYAYAVNNKTTIDEMKEWIEKAKNENGWVILVFHQIGNGKEKYEITRDTLEKILDTSIDSGLPIVLPSDALQLMDTQ